MRKEKDFEPKEQLHYSVDLGAKYDNIFASDFWLLEYFNSKMLPQQIEPLKFTTSASIFVRKGSWKASINLKEYSHTGPCIVNVRQSQILQILEISPDFEASVIVMSKRFTDNLFLMLRECHHYLEAMRSQVTPLSPDVLPEFEQLYRQMNKISKNPGQYSYQALTLGMSSFFYSICERVYPLKRGTSRKDMAQRLHDQFIALVEANFKKERFLEFYADKLQVSTKHLSRTVKSVSGYTAVEWLERYIILEAKVLLKSTNMNVQQISDALNFPSQSLFGKYFKKCVGMSPKDFRSA